MYFVDMNATRKLVTPNIAASLDLPVSDGDEKRNILDYIYSKYSANASIS